MNNPPAITISGQMLEPVSTFKYLGLLLTSDLSWSKHIIEGIYTKAKKILGLLYRQFYLLTRRLFFSYMYRLYGPTWSTQHKSGIRT